jgi:phosphonate transport system substrate-binding protein
MVNKSRNLLLILCLALFVIYGCERGEVPKKVSLQKRSSKEDNNVRPVDETSLKFGFDLRLRPAEDVRIYLPLLQYLETITGHRFSLRFTERYEDTVANLGSGITQFAALGPVNAVLAKERYPVAPLVMGLNPDGKPEYRAVIFTRIDSPLNNIKDLKGKSFAFGDKFSTQGHLIPRKMLEDVGILLNDLSRYVFTGSHSNTARAVLRGDYEAGGMQDNLARRLFRGGKIKILASSKAYPSSLICFNENLDPDVVKAVKEALLSFDPKEKHAGILVDWDKTEMPRGFTEYRGPCLAKVAELVKRYGLQR